MMKISKFKLIWKFLTGGKEAVLDYVLDVANDFAQNLDDEKREHAYVLFERGLQIFTVMDSLKSFCPHKWYGAYEATLTAFAGLVMALRDLKVTKEELGSVMTKFRVAYDYWMSDEDENNEVVEKADKTDSNAEVKEKA